jgi:ribosome-binding protein aMBF1 (putative translation factor)
MFISGDPYADFDRWDAENAKYDKHFPTCYICGGRIYQETAVHIPKSDIWVCDDCLYEIRESTEQNL